MDHGTPADIDIVRIGLSHQMSFQRNLSVDLVRLAAVFGVVIIHLAPSTEAAEKFTQLFWHFAVPFFILISLYYFVTKVNALPSLMLSDLRVDRILAPYAVWTVIYTLMRWIKFHLGGQPFSIDVIGLIFFGGGAVQLYFLPLLLLFQAQALAVILMFRAIKWRWIGVCVALGAVVFSYVASAGGYFNHALETGLTYVGLTFLLVYAQARSKGRQINKIIGWLILALIVSTAYFGHPLNALGMMRGPVVGYGVAAFALNWRFKTTTPVLCTVLTCSYGIYLAHVGFLEGFEFAAGKFGYILTPYSVVTKVLMGGLICLCCVLFIVIARLHWLSAYLFLGEATRK